MKKLLLLVGFFCLTSPIFSQWSTDPLVNNSVSTALTDQSNVVSCPDGAGGLIMAWNNGVNRIYAQKINQYGQTQWQSQGILVANAGNQANPIICSDAGGGAIIAWREARNGAYDIYAQRIATDGALLWDGDGVRVTAHTYPALDKYKCLGAEPGTVIIVWSTIGSGLYAQKLDANSNRIWNAGDVQITSTVSPTYPFDICPNAKNGVYVSWAMANSGFGYDIYAQNIRFFGDVVWSADKLIATFINDQTLPTMCEDQTYGFIVAWQDHRETAPAQTDIYAARVDTFGVNKWTPNGKAICTTPDNQTQPVCVSDLHSGAHIIWFDDRLQPVPGAAIYGQNINYNAQLRWLQNGTRIAHRVEDVQTQDNRFNPKITTVDAAGGLISCWIGYYDDALTQFGIIAQRMDYNGNILWGANGTMVTTGPLKKGPALVFDGGASGCNVTWVDGRNFGSNGYDIYAQHVKSNANLGNRPVPNPNGSKTALVKQNFPNPFNPVTSISFDVREEGLVSLKIYDMMGREVAVLANQVYTAGEYSVTWDASNFATGTYLYKFTANGKTEIKTMMLIK